MKLTHAIEYGAAKFLLTCLDLMSLKASYRLADFAAGAWYAFNPSRRRTAINNILKCRLAVTREEAAVIARRSFCSFVSVMVESLKTGQYFTESDWRNQVELDISPAAMQLLESKSGIILVSGHFGNWEVAAQLLSYIKPVVGITRKMNNPLVEELVLARKPRNNFRLTPKHDVDGGRFLKILRNGEVLAILSDQYAKDHGMMIDFFGIPASTHTSPAMLHLLTKAPILFGYCVRTGPMKFKLKAIDPIIVKPSGNRENDTRLILTQINTELEKAIREYSEQYLWAHRRWR